MMKFKLMIFMSFFISTQVHAEACSYDEAVLALQRGNTVRAHALLKMAASDGDKRAQRLVASLQHPTSPTTPTTKEKQHPYWALGSLAQSSLASFPDSSSQ